MVRHNGYARIIGKNRKILGDLPPEFVMFDTDTETYSGARNKLDSFYRNPLEDDEKVMVYFCKWIDDDRILPEIKEHAKKLPFSERYSKHSFQVFPTIRRRDKYGNVGVVVEVDIK